MTEINYDSIVLRKKYLGGISMENESIRKISYTIMDAEEKDLIGVVYYAEVHTPKDKHGYHLGGKTLYYTEDSKEYKSVKWLLKSILIAKSVN